MCSQTDQVMHNMSKMIARAADMGSETGPQEITIPHAIGTEYERNTND